MYYYTPHTTTYDDLKGRDLATTAHRFGKTEFINSVDLKEQAQEALVPE